MSLAEKYEQWKTDAFFDEETRLELSTLTDDKEIEDRFYKDLEFGTGGMRGIMGAGTNRVNRYTLGRASTGLGNYLLEQYGAQACRERGVVIAYDTRNHSRELASASAAVLSGKGIRVLLLDDARPTPQLSFSVRHYDALAGIVITASHNPKEYNGYKVYDEKGVQLVPAQAAAVTEYINRISDYRSVSFAGDKALIQTVDDTDAFVSAVLKQSRYKDAAAKAELRVVYTPLHGAGRIPVQKALAEDGFVNVFPVEEQMTPDGDFPTVASPNPEDRRALEMGIAYAREVDADIVLGTDPDSDRVGIAVRTDDGYQLLTGNQIGALVMDHILSCSDMSAYKKPAIVKTIVTSELGAEIARSKGLAVFSTLTGFKYIGEKISQFEQAKAEGDTKRDYDFVFGYEESYGYLAGTHARDKDAVVSGMLICEMAARLKKEGKTPADRMAELYKKYGYYRDALDSFTLAGKDGLERIAGMMRQLRSGQTRLPDVQDTIDYSTPVPAEPGFGELPAADVLKYILADGSWIAVRPSGTEPKLKIYYSVRGADETAADERLTQYRQALKAQLGL